MRSFHLALGVGAALLVTSRVTSALSTLNFVTGANGYLGRAIVRELVSSLCPDDKVVCLVRSARVTAEQAYWDGQLKRQQTQTDSTARRQVCVRPYDMLDGGITFDEALREQLQSTENDSAPRTICLYHVASVFGPTNN